MIDGADLDHVALAGESRAALEKRYAGDLGGLALAEGPGYGFWWAQLEFANGMALEMLEPNRVEDNDFLRRFLDRNGPGPHHLTFKVPDFHVALEEAERAGYSPVGVNESDPDWKEAFLHPKDAPGVVVQLAESHEHVVHPTAGPGRARAALSHVGHAVASLEEGRRLFVGLLGGEVLAGGEETGHRWEELGWPGPGRVRLLAPTGDGPLRDWLGPRAGRVHHLAFSVEDPASVPDVAAYDVTSLAAGTPGPEDGGSAGNSASAGTWVVEPSHNLGTRLVLTGR